MDALQTEVGHRSYMTTWHSLPLEFTGGMSRCLCLGAKCVLHRINVPNEFRTVNSDTTGTITPMFSFYDRIKPNLKQKAATARGKWLVRKDWGKLRGVKSLCLSENTHEK